jgi:hypothetical protein
MKTFGHLLLALAACVLAAATSTAQIPQLLNYQGRVAVSGTNFNGTGQFKFALVSGTGATTYWSNDGTSTNGSEPTSAVPLTVSNGLYSVQLGNPSLTNMTVPLNPSVFVGRNDVRLRVWFNDGSRGSQLLTPDQRITAVAYAMVTGDPTVVRLTPPAAQSATGVQQANAAPFDAMLNLHGTATDVTGNTQQGDFRVNLDSGFYAAGPLTLYNQAVPVEGAGTRMMWYPGKAAFRAGQVSNTQWDDANIGLFSSAFGQDVRALGDHSFAQGLNAVAASVASIAMGQDVVATGANSVVLGYKAISSTGGGTPRTGTFVFGDRSVSSTGSALTASLTNSAHWRVANGFFIYTSSTLGSGVQVTAGSGSWSSLSDRDAKENFAPVDTREILRGVVEMPITTWNYKTQDPSIRHIGAMAQDFHSAFGIGEDDKHISTIDPDGVALAAIRASMQS